MSVCLSLCISLCLFLSLSLCLSLCLSLSVCLSLSLQAKGVPLFPCMDCSCVFKKLGSLNAHISKMHISIIDEPSNTQVSVHHQTSSSLSAAWITGFWSHLSVPPLSSCPPPPVSPLQEVEETCGGGAGSEGSEVVTDVIQQLLELSEQVAGESSQPQAQEQAITMETAINQDILQASVA